MALETWEAECLDDILRGGRTRPLVLTCSRANDIANEQFVVKACGMPEVTPTSLVNEVFGNMLARELGVNTPRPVIVSITDLMAEAINSTGGLEPNRVQSGLASGCEYLTGLVGATPLVGLSDEEAAQAAHIYAFDLLVQNPDRRLTNPNHAKHEGTLVAYDFEMTFSFQQLIGTPPAPWAVSTHGISATHVLRSRIRQEVDWEPFVQRLESMMRGTFDDLVSSLPRGWRPQAQSVKEHLESIVSHSDDFKVELHRSLQ